MAVSDLGTSTDRGGWTRRSEQKSVGTILPRRKGERRQVDCDIRIILPRAWLSFRPSRQHGTAPTVDRSTPSQDATLRPPHVTSGLPVTTGRRTEPRQRCRMHRCGTHGEPRRHRGARVGPPLPSRPRRRSGRGVPHSRSRGAAPGRRCRRRPDRSLSPRLLLVPAGQPRPGLDPARLSVRRAGHEHQQGGTRPSGAELEVRSLTGAHAEKAAEPTGRRHIAHVPGH